MASAPSATVSRTPGRPRLAAISCRVPASAVTMSPRMASRGDLASDLPSAGGRFSSWGRSGLGVIALGLVLTLGRAAPASTPPALSANGVPVSAEAVVLLDLETGKVLFEKNAEGDRAPASLVKMMTLYLAYDELRAGHVTLGEPV